jgi:hypothetical protein
VADLILGVQKGPEPWSRTPPLTMPLSTAL